MLPRKLQDRSSNFYTRITRIELILSKEFNGENDHAKDKHEKTNAIDPMHISHPFCFGFVRLSKIEVL